MTTVKSEKSAEHTPLRKSSTSEFGGELLGLKGQSSDSEPELPIAKFAESRGFKPSFLAKYGIRLAVESDDCPTAGEWVTIPYRNLTGVWHNKYRLLGDGGPKYFAPHGSAGHLYNPALVGPNAEIVWITEGEFDCLSLIALGHAAVGTPGASGFKEVWKHLFTDATVIVAYDPDEAGRAGAVKIANLFRNGYVFDGYPDSRDLNDWYRDDRHGMAESISEWMTGRGL